MTILTAISKQIQERQHNTDLTRKLIESNTVNSNELSEIMSNVREQVRLINQIILNNEMIVALTEIKEKPTKHLIQGAIEVIDSKIINLENELKGQEYIRTKLRNMDMFNETENLQLTYSTISLRNKIHGYVQAKSDIDSLIDEL